MLKSFIEFLEEARSHPDLNPKISMMAKIEPYRRKSGYYITFTHINKVGINPDNEYGTPYGIYCYPVKEMWNDIAKNSVPFANDRPFVTILKKKNGKMLDCTATSADVKRCHKILVKKYRIPDDIRDASYDANYGKAKNNFQAIWFMSRYAAIKQSGMNPSEKVNINDKDPKLTMKWNFIMRKDLGYIGAQDLRGEGIIHPNEPIQAVFFSKDALETVETFDNKRFNDDALFNSGRKSGDDNSQLNSAMGILNKCCGGKINGDITFYVPYGVKSTNDFKTEIKGNDCYIRNFGINRINCDATNGNLHFEKCTFKNYTRIHKASLDKCFFGSANTTYLVDCKLSNCSFAMSDLGVLWDMSKMANAGMSLKPAECKLYVGTIDNDSRPSNFKFAIDCGVLVKKNREFAKRASNPGSFFFYLATLTSAKNPQWVSLDKRTLTTAAIMNFLCNSTMAVPEPPKDDSGDILGKIKRELSKLGTLREEPEGLFVPHGQSEKSITIEKTSNGLVVKNLGISKTIFLAKSAGTVTFQNCVVTGDANQIVDVKNVTFENCILTDPEEIFYRNCTLKNCSFAIRSVEKLKRLSDLANEGNGDCKWDARETDIYIGKWDSSMPPFNPSSCKLHFTYNDVVKKYPEMAPYANDNAAYYSKLLSVWDDTI